MPYKRLLPAGLLGRLARDCPRFRFLKDTCCDREQLRAKSAAVAGTELKIYNANLTTLADSLRDGCAGFSGIAANFFPDALAALMRILETDPARADRMQIVFNTLERNVEFHYPRGAKEYLKQQGLPLTDFCRTPRPGFTAEELEQIRDFGRFVELWKQSGYNLFTQEGQK
ncbi:dihydrodipicolinate synthase family protein [uncultured Victivallis sp.]|uniref:dihydrodipicolinate synthase family protein n=1 Tax=uncultured Victivallis sp. TaxID=354118 RepID=UPI002598A38C|nr:dihydrodipicolinate synthase family protein [uncultured Victivallis sp.]